MKHWFCGLVLGTMLAANLPAEDWELDLGALVEGQVELLADLTALEPAELRLICLELQQQFQGDYLLDLAPLQEVAAALLPLLDAHADTQSYAAWLRARMDYFAAAEALQVRVPGVVLPLTTPPATVEREFWQEQLKNEPLPERAGFYVPRLQPVFAEVGVPIDLVWIAEVESRFIPHARSPVGAVGLFQLMPETADWLGLALEPLDERLDPLQNARAAARYLRYLYGQFKDWPLVVAAYNGGEGRVRRLLAERKARQFEEIAPYLPTETRLYVPKVEAVLQERAGVALGDLAPPTVAETR